MPARNARKIEWRHGPYDSPPRDLVILNIPGPCTHADIIQRVCERLKLRVEPLPEPLRHFTYTTGREIQEGAGSYFDKITAKHENMYWSYSDGVVRFEVRAGRNLSPCVEVAGRLWHEASRGDGGRVSDAALAGIAAEVDNRSFKPVEQLEGKARENVARYNQTHPDKAIHTFSDAIKKQSLTVTDPKSDRLIERPFRPRRAVRRWFSRCGEKWEKAHPGA
jgi:hypothetical protein